ncbi:prosaposin-like [Haliotis cracherodii]|uniref:prosaposin-like n=1 Tax=Haliotis cracherodii TaxID=6455 RepID=UPI0039E7A7EA
MNTSILIIALCVSVGSAISLPNNWNIRQLGTSSTEDDDACTNCKETLTAVIARLDTDEGVVMVEQLLKDEICSHLSSYFLTETCNSAVHGLVPGLLEYVVENADPEVLCSLAMLCPEKQKNHFKMITNVDVKTGDDGCTNCIEVVDSFIESLNTDEVKEQVETYFDHVICSPLSAYFLEEVCTAEVCALIPGVLDYIVENADPKGLCTLATLCPENVKGKPSTVQVTDFLQKIALIFS